jgi:TonB family protein
VNEAVDRLIAERARLDAGLPPWVLVSLTAHLVLAALVVAAPFLLPKQPVLNVAEFAVVLPRGGGGTPHVEPPPAAAKPAPPAPAPAPKVVKPAREAPKPDALPEPDSRRRAPRRQDAPQVRATPAEPKPSATPGTEAAAATPGLAIGGPPGPGVPTGTDTGGDWYMAAVQQKIWLLWNQQVKAGFRQPVAVTFTIVADGGVEDVHVSQSSGAALLDMAAQRAILNAAPFGPLPREYGTNRKTIQAIFTPTG